MLVTIYLWKSDYQWWLVYISYWASGKHWLSTTALSRLHSHIYIYLFSFVLASNILSHYIKFYPLSVTMGSLWLSSKSIQNSVHYHKQLNEFCWNLTPKVVPRIIFEVGGEGERSINLNIVIYYWTERYEIGVGVMKVQHLENNGKAFNGLH